MLKRYKNILISISLFILCVIGWIGANMMNTSGGMNTLTSIAIFGSLGAVFFFLTTILFLMLKVMSITKSHFSKKNKI